MKKWKVDFLTFHESYNGYDHSNGWTEYEVDAKTKESAMNKAKKLWKKEFHSAYWIQNSMIRTID